VVRRQGNEVRFEVVAMSRPASLITRLGGPVSRRIHVDVTHRYLRAMQAAVADR